MNFEKTKSEQNIASLFSILLFFLFTLCMVFVMVVGANVYKNIINQMDNNFIDRTGISYITNKVRQYDYTDNVSVVEIEGKTVLELIEPHTDVDYHTLIYILDGEICELFKEVEVDLPLSEGIRIIAADHVDFKMEKDGLLYILVEGANGPQHTYVNLRSGDKNE